MKSEALPSCETERSDRWLYLLREGRGAFGIYIALITHFWWPALMHGRQMVFGDAAHHGLSLLAFLSEGLRGERYLLWESGIYGGHPLFAESQGGFVNPVNLLCALLFTPEYGIGVLHWLEMLIVGSGIYTLCRLLKLSRWAATFACITTGYSSIWLSLQYNISVTGTMAWLPWLLAAVEYWLNKPTPRRASLMAVPAALTIFGGYPHLAYGAAVYLAVYCLCLPLKIDGRALLKHYTFRLLSGGLLALMLAVALSAIQLIPLIELAGHSHRTDGIGIQFGDIISAASYMRGLIFFDWTLPQPLTSFGSLSSLSACLFAVIALMFRPPARPLAHGLAALFLFNLGTEYASPLFRLLYEHHLLPGLHSFRIMHPFFVQAALGFSILAAYGLSELAQRSTSSWHLAPAIVFLAALSISLFDPALSLSNFVIPTLIAVSAVTLSVLKKLVWLPLLATLLIGADAALLRSDIYSFYDASILEKPELVNAVQKDPDIINFRVGDYVNPLLSTFKLSNDPIHQLGYRQILDSLSPFPAVRWGIPSINGVLALELERRGLINEQILKEVAGTAALPAGKRLIDLLGVKYVSFAVQLHNEGFELLAKNPETGVYIHRNNAALPKIRAYPGALFVESSEQALKLIQEGHGDQLIVEGDNPTDSPCSGTPPTINAPLRRSSHYLIETQSDCPIWLFVSDADYPGWRAYIDDSLVTHYPANILGKAVYVPAGSHMVELRFTPWSFYAGCTISSMALAAVLIITLKRRTDE